MEAPDASEQRTLWVGDIEQWMDESYVMSCFAHVGEVVSVKLIRDKTTMIPSGYGFVEFMSHASAIKVLENYNSSPIPNAGRSFRLNWATMGAGSKGGAGGGAPSSSMPSMMSNAGDFAIYIGDLSPDVTDVVLQSAFSQRYPSVKNAKIVTDPATGISKGYGFVRFNDDTERARAMMEMQGQLIGQRPIRISGATPRKVGATTSTSMAMGMPSLVPTINPALNAGIPTINPAIVPMAASPTLPPPSPSTAQSYYPYMYNSTAAAGSYGMDVSAYYANYMAPQKVVDFTLPIDVNELNEDYIQGKMDQFTAPYLPRSHHGIVPDPDGPDPLIVS